MEIDLYALPNIILKIMGTYILQSYSHGDKTRTNYFLLFVLCTDKDLVVFYRDDALNTRNFHDAINTWLFDVSHFLSASLQNDIKWEI